MPGGDATFGLASMVPGLSPACSQCWSAKLAPAWERPLTSTVIGTVPIMRHFRAVRNDAANAALPCMMPRMLGDPVTLAEYPHLHGTTVLDRTLGCGLAITTVPAEAFPGGPPRSDEDIARGLDADVVGRLDGSAEPVILATLASMIGTEDAQDVLSRMDRLVTADPDNPLSGVDPSVRAFVEHCAFEPIVGVEESPLKPKVLAGMFAGATAVCVAALAAGAGVVVAAVVGVGVVVTVAVVGPPAVAVGERLAEWVASK